MTKLEELDSNAITRKQSKSKNQRKRGLGRLWAESSVIALILAAVPFYLAGRLTRCY